MLRSSKGSYLILFLTLWFVGPVISAQTTVVSEDESGTLVMVARTRLAVVVSVDSEIRRKGENPGVSGWDDGERKLVDVGETGACALEGYMGQHNEQVGVADYLRTWVRQHPTEDPVEGFEGLLNAAARGWNEVPHIEFLVNTVSPTYLICGDIVGGHPVIVRGQTYQLRDGSAGYKRLPVPPGDILYVGGVISTGLFRRLFENPFDIKTTGPESSSARDAYLKIGRDMRSNISAMNAFNIYTNVERSGVDSPLRKLCAGT